MMAAAPLLCHPFPGQETHVRSLRQALDRQERFDPARHTVGPLETARHPHHAVMMRQSILMRVYRGDYHTDCFDVDRLAGLLASGMERIWFWGEAEEIDGFLTYCAGDPPNPPDLRLGTVTVLPAEFAFGPGRHELCRSGSCDSTLGAKGPSLLRLLNFIGRHGESGSAAGWVLTPRNRASAPGLRGGEAVHRLHSHHLRSRFWGFAPWYVMQGGSLEMLDLRECDRDSEEVADSPDWGQPWVLRDPAAAAFVAALTRLNYGRVPPIEVVADSDACGGLPARTGKPYGAAIQPFNPTVLVVGAEGDVPLHEAHAMLAGRKACALVARLALTDPAAPGAQAFLEQVGYRLTSILPPKRGVPPRGFWTRLQPHNPLAPPHYLDRGGGPDETTVLDYCRKRLMENQ